MIYIFLSDQDVEIILTKKNILSGEKITGSIRREIPREILDNGLIIGAAAADFFKDILSNIYKGEIQQDSLLLCVSDRHVIHKRFKLVDQTSGDLTGTILDNVKASLDGDISEYEHFYKVTDLPENAKRIVYTAIPRETIKHFSDFFGKFRLNLTYLTSQSFALHELLKFLINDNENFLYTEIGHDVTNSILLDPLGPIAYRESSNSDKSVLDLIKNDIHSLNLEHSLKITHIILNGIKSLEIPVSELSEYTSLPVAKMSDIIEKIMAKNSIRFDSGGTAYMLFSNVLGLYLIAKDTESPNFVKDIDSTEISQEQKKANVLSDVALPTIEKTDSAKKGFFTLPKIILLIFVLIIAAVLLFFGLSPNKNKSQIALPFFSKPTVTPTPTTIPTLTPTPTIDTTLKRSSLKISVQNGTDKAGYAKDIASFLEVKGYKNVQKSNADNTDYKDSIIKIKDSMKKYTQLLVQDIGTKFETANIQSLEDGSNYDAVIILGQK